MTFYTGIATPTEVANNTFAPDQRQLSFSGGAITERTWAGQGTVPNMTFPTLTGTKTLIGKVQARAGGTPIFSYWTYDDTDSNVNTPPVLTQHTGTIAAADLPRIVQVDIGFTANPTKGPANSQTQVDFSDSVLIRVQANPNDTSIATAGPQCKL